MLKGDRFLLGIVVGIIILALATAALVLAQSSPEYLDEDTPAGVAHNYLLALQFGEYERAVGYIAACVQDIERDPELFGELVERDYRFNGLRRDTSLVVEETYLKDGVTVVKIQETEFDDGFPPFDSRVERSTFLMSLIEVEGAWRLLDGERYWGWDWDVDGCP